MSPAVDAHFQKTKAPPRTSGCQLARGCCTANDCSRRACSLASRHCSSTTSSCALSASAAGNSRLESVLRPLVLHGHLLPQPDLSCTASAIQWMVQAIMQCSGSFPVPSFEKETCLWALGCSLSHGTCAWSDDHGHKPGVACCSEQTQRPMVGTAMLAASCT
jgi:hypothetical protein